MSDRKCPSQCDDDCEETCHEVHVIPYRRTHEVDSCQTDSGPVWAPWVDPSMPS